MDPEIFIREAQSIDKILENYKKTGEKFVDPNFHPTKKISDSQLSNSSTYKWQRVDSLLKSKLFENMSPDSLCQGSLGDCYFLAVLSSLCKDVNRVKTLFDPRSSIEAGAVIVIFFAAGQKLPVLVDTLLPFKRGTRTPMFSHPKNTSESYWFCLVEKAYAKLHGSYANIVGGSFTTAVYNIFGYVPCVYQASKFTDAQICTKIQKWQGYGCIIGTSVNSSFKKDDIIDLGLVQNHEYLVVEAKEADGKHFIKLRNPWGDHEWLGDYSDCSDKWTSSLKKKLNYSDADDGSFWMLISDYKKYYGDLDVSKPIKPGFFAKSKIVNLYNDQKKAPTFEVTFKQPHVLSVSCEPICCENCKVHVQISTGDTNFTFSSASNIISNKAKNLGQNLQYRVTPYSSSSVPSNAKILVRFIGKGDFDVVLGGKNVKGDSFAKLHSLKSHPKDSNKDSQHKTEPSSNKHHDDDEKPKVKTMAMVNGKPVDPDSDEYKKIFDKLMSQNESKGPVKKILIIDGKTYDIENDKQFDKIMEEFNKNRKPGKMTKSIRTVTKNGVTTETTEIKTS